MYRTSSRMAAAISCLLLIGCGKKHSPPAELDAGVSQPSATAESTPPPAAGKGNITGIVHYDGKPVGGIDVKLCEKFSTIGFAGCSGETYTAKTDEQGVYVVRDAAAGDYQGLLVRLFDSDSWMYASRDVMSARKYTVRAGATAKADDSALYKSDATILAPRAGARVLGPTPEMRWAAYPGAAFYELSLTPELIPGQPMDLDKPRFTRLRVDKTSFVPDKPLKPGRYGLQVDVHGVSKGNPKIAESARKRVFIVAPENAPDTGDPTPAVAPARSRPSPPSFEVAKPAAGFGAVQGTVLFDDAAVSGIEVQLCEKFAQHFGGCSGKIYTTKSDGRGIYLIKDVPPMEYEGLTARVFNTRNVIYVASGILGTDKKRYRVEADKTLVAPATHLFKADLRISAPPANAKLPSPRFVLQWEPYPGAAFYAISIHVDYSGTGPKPTKLPAYAEFAVDGTSFMLDEPLENGPYMLSVVAYNAWGQKLADSAHGTKFSIAAK